MASRIFIVTILVSQLLGIYCWDYHNPDEWAKKNPECAGKRESPVNIDSSKITINMFGKKIKFMGHDAKPKTIQLMNNGHTVVLKPTFDAGKEATVSGGPLNGTYVFDGLHFHWGPNNKKGSEHTVDQNHFPLEMHMVHYKKDYGSVQDSLSKPDGLAVVGVVFSISNDSCPILTKLSSKFPKVKNQNDKTMVEPFPLSEFQLSEQKYFITYQGSLTTPPCSQVVSWILGTKDVVLETKYKPGKEPSLSNGPLNGTYVLDGIHFHWGMTNENGSMHGLNGQYYPLEMHFVHYKKDCGSTKAALSKPDGHAFLGLVFRLDRKKNPGLTKLEKELPKVKNPNDKTKLKNFPIFDFQVKQSSFSTYQDSLKTPVCTKNTTWIMAGIQQIVTDQQMKAFREVMVTHDDKVINGGIVQPPKDIKFRLVQT